MRAFYLKVIFTMVLFFFSVSGSPVNSTTIAIPEFDELEVKNSVSYSIVIVPCRRGFRKIRNKCRPVFSPTGDNDDSNVLSMLTL